MKVYNQVVQRLADRAFDSYMGGSMNSPLYGLDVGLVGFIYGKTNSEVTHDVEVAFDWLCMDHNDRVRTQELARAVGQPRE